MTEHSSHGSTPTLSHPPTAAVTAMSCPCADDSHPLGWRGHGQHERRSLGQRSEGGCDCSGEADRTHSETPTSSTTTANATTTTPPARTAAPPHARVDVTLPWERGHGQRKGFGEIEGRRGDADVVVKGDVSTRSTHDSLSSLAPRHGSPTTPTHRRVSSVRGFVKWRL